MEFFGSDALEKSGQLCRRDVFTVLEARVGSNDILHSANPGAWIE